MATLLVNPKMHPLLAARVEASVSGRRKSKPLVRSTARVVLLLRLGVVFGIIGVVASVVVSRHQERAAFERSKSALLSEWTTQAGGLSAQDREYLTRTERILRDIADAYSGDFIAPALQSPGAVKSHLGRRLIYVRGPQIAFSAPNGIARLASESGLDSLLLCLLEPPTTRGEKAFLPQARSALAGGPELRQLAPNVHRLHDIEQGLPYLLPPWGERLHGAKDMPALQRLERELRRAPIAATRSAMGAELLLAVVDEPNDAGGVTELDGEHAHHVRVVLWDLHQDAALIRLRRHVDPAWITANRRSQYSRELDSCKLALEVHDAIRNAANP